MKRATRISGVDPPKGPGKWRPFSSCPDDLRRHFRLSLLLPIGHVDRSGTPHCVLAKRIEFCGFLFVQSSTRVGPHRDVVFALPLERERSRCRSAPTRLLNGRFESRTSYFLGTELKTAGCLRFLEDEPSQRTKILSPNVVVKWKSGKRLC